MTAPLSHIYGGCMFGYTDRFIKFLVLRLVNKSLEKIGHFLYIFYFLLEKAFLTLLGRELSVNEQRAFSTLLVHLFLLFNPVFLKKIFEISKFHLRP